MEEKNPQISCVSCPSNVGNIYCCHQWKYKMEIMHWLAIHHQSQLQSEITVQVLDATWIAVICHQSCHQKIAKATLHHSSSCIKKILSLPNRQFSLPLKIHHKLFSGNTEIVFGELEIWIGKWRDRAILDMSNWASLWRYISNLYCRCRYVKLFKFL